MLKEVQHSIPPRELGAYYASSAIIMDEQFKLTDNLGITHVHDGMYFINVLGQSLLNVATTRLADVLKQELPHGFWQAWEARVANPFGMTDRYKCRKDLGVTIEILNAWVDSNNRNAQSIYVSGHEVALKGTLERACADFVAKNAEAEVDIQHHSSGVIIDGRELNPYFKKWAPEIRAINRALRNVRTDANTGVPTAMDKLDYAKHPWQTLRYFQVREMM